MYRMFFVIRHTGARHFYGDPVETIEAARELVARLNDNRCRAFDYGFAVVGLALKNRA